MLKYRSTEVLVFILECRTDSNANASTSATLDTIHDWIQSITRTTASTIAAATSTNTSTSTYSINTNKSALAAS